MSQKRDHFRIPYPISERPRIVMGAVELEVLDLSERGARVALGDSSSVPGDTPCAATIRFKDGTTAGTTAIVHRREFDQLVLRFSNELPFSLIAAEQRRLLKLFPRGALEPAAAAQ